MKITTPTPSLRELDCRSGDGIEVRLLWNPLTDRVSVHVDDARSNESFAFPVAAGEELTAFQHPYAYADRDSSIIGLLPWD